MVEDNNLISLSLLELSEQRYLNPRVYNIPKSSHWFNEILPSYNDKRFKKILRMTQKALQN